LLAQLGLTEDEIREQAEKTKEVIKKRDQVFREGRPFPVLKDRTVILVEQELVRLFGRGGSFYHREVRKNEC
jgi:predicted phosphoribosyltransferase